MHISLSLSIYKKLTNHNVEGAETHFLHADRSADSC